VYVINKFLMYLWFSLRNGIDVEGASHKQVVDLIKHSGDELHLIGK
jgi:hypothetical protein